MIRKLFNYFASGLLLVAPICITLWIIVTGIQKLDGLLPVSLEIEGYNKLVYFPGLGLLIIIIVDHPSRIHLLCYSASVVFPDV